MRWFLLFLASTLLLVSPALGEGPADTRPCTANFSDSGSFWSGHDFKSFQEYPNSSKAATFDYLLTKIASIGYTITSHDKDAGLISATFQSTASLNAVISEGKPTGVRVDLTFIGQPGVAYSDDDARTEFCSILDGVPINSSASVTPTPQATPAPTVAGKASISVDEAKVLSAPQDGAKVLATVYKGESYDVVNETTGWFKIKLDDGSFGYVPRTAVSIETSPTAPSPAAAPAPRK